MGDSLVDLLSYGSGVLAEHLDACGDGPFRAMLLSESGEKFRQTVDRDQGNLGRRLISRNPCLSARKKPEILKTGWNPDFRSHISL